ncbi:MAG: ABC transporter ATP-binding protein [Lachnospiraceae bacterium]|nr:ABC transporter ATP-binding protein [Lachnospiraceae bacterium]
MYHYENAIEIKNLCKNYDGFSLKNLNLTVPKGTIMGFVGQNGAGKTTTIKSILNIIRPEQGEIYLFGMHHQKQEIQIKNRIGVVFDELPFHDQLTPTQLNNVLAGIYSSWDSKCFFQYLERFSLPLKKKMATFSKGMKMKLQIAAALSHNAELLIMDEATSGLDPVVRSEMLDVFLEFMQDENHSILMSSHITSDLEKVADSITFVHNGTLLLSGYKDDILSAHGIVKCSKENAKKVAPEDIISMRCTDFGVEIMVNDRKNCQKKYSNFVMDSTTLDEILLFYVRGLSKKEWW